MNHNNKFLPKLIVSILLIVGLFSGNMITVSADDSTTVDVLARIVNANSSHELSLLVGSGKSSFSAEKISISQATRENLDHAKGLKTFLSEGGVAYKDFSTEIVKKDMKVKDGLHILNSTEHIKLTSNSVDIDTGEFIRTEYIQKRQTSFTNKFGAWKVVEDKILFPFERGEDVEYELSPSESQDSVSPPPASTGSKFDVMSRVAAPSAINISATNAVNYATKYWTNYNKDYRSYSGKGGDCTNFISQAMRAGGWGDTSWWEVNHKNNKYWGYSWVGQTYSWVGVEDFYQFTVNNSKRGYVANTWGCLCSPSSSVWSKMDKGDVVQIDFENDKIWDHTTIITAKDTKGMIFLTYHSTNTLNKPALQIIYDVADKYRWKVQSMYRGIKMY